MSILIRINHSESRTEAATIMELAAELSLPDKGVAIAVNNRIIPRTAWDITSLCEGDEITVIKAAFGG